MPAGGTMRRTLGVSRAVFPRADCNDLAFSLGHDTIDEVSGDGLSLRRFVVHSPDDELPEDVRLNGVVVAHVDPKPSELRIADDVPICLVTVDLHPCVRHNA